MTKDYKKTADTHSSSGNYSWMFSGIALGLIVGLGMYFYSNYQASLVESKNGGAEGTESTALGNHENQTDSGIQEPDPISVVIESARAEQQDKKRASFSYYAVLPNLELDVAVKQSEKDKPIEEQQKIILKPGTHILQIASFKTNNQALRVQGELAKQNLETHIEKKQIKGKNWYRLFAGPSEQQKDIDGWKLLVEKAGFRPLIIKVK